MGKNSGKRYSMAYCLVKENISARTCPNQRMNNVVIAVKYKVFIEGEFMITRRSVESDQGRILGLAWFTLRKWPVPAKTKIVLSVSQFKKQITCLVRNRLIRAKMIDINTKIK